MTLPDVNAIVRAYLADAVVNPALDALVNGRIYCPRLPENAALPAIGFFTRGGTSSPYIPDLPNPSCQFDCWAKDELQLDGTMKHGAIIAREVYRALYDALQGIQEIEVGNVGSPGWVTPTGFNDPSGTWSDETKAYDDDIVTFAEGVNASHGWSDFLELLVPNMSCSSLRYYLPAWGIGDASEIDLDVYYGGGWHDIYQGALAYNNAWNVKALGITKIVSKMRFRYYNGSGMAGTPNAYEFDFYGAPTYKILSAIEEVQGQDLVDVEIPNYFRTLCFFSIMVR